MKSVPFEQVSAAFEQVCDQPPQRRSALLDQICGDDDDLRAAVEEMLVADVVSSPLLDRPPEQGVAHALAQDIGPIAPEPPRRIPTNIGPYRIVREIGAGGMGVVYEAEQDHPRRLVALKCVHPSLHSELIDRQFHVEAEVMGQLLHPSIPHVYEASEADGVLYIAMELVQGDPLPQFLRLRQPSLPQRINLLIELCDATAHAHDQGVIHCDLKPSNVLITEAGAAKVLDFGVARFVRGGARTPAMGTPAYMSPEQLRNAEGLDGRADVYALGVVAYEVLVGRPPFALVRNPRSALEAIEAGAPALNLGRDLRARDLEAVVTRAMAWDRAKRYPTATALGDELRRTLRDEPVQARPSTLGYRLAKRLARHRAGVRTVVAVLAAILLGFALLRGGQSTLQRWALERANETAAAALPQMLAEYSVQAARGDQAGADAALQGFMTGPGLRGTATRSEAWLQYGALLHKQERADEELDAYAAAYAAATSPELRTRALYALAQAFRDRWDFEALDVVLKTIGGQDGAEPQRQQWRQDVLLARRDLGGAAELTAKDGESTAPLLRALAAAHATPFVGDEAPRMDIDGDGQDELLFWDPAAQRIMVAGVHKGLVPRGELVLPPLQGMRANRVFAAPHDRPEILAQYSDTERQRAAALFPLDANTLSGAPMKAWLWDEPSVAAVHSADIDGDGHREVYAGTGAYTRRLVRLDPSHKGWRESSPHPATDSLDSGVGPFVDLDLDGDGSAELLVAAREWLAYGVRRYRAKGEGLQLLDQVRLGTTRWLGRFRRAGGKDIALAFVDRGFANPQLFGPEFPFPGPFGWYALDLNPQGRLRAMQIAPYRAPFGGRPPRWWSAETGDFDGDGLQDIALGEYRGHTLLLRQRPDGAFAEALVSGIRPLAALNVDDDPADELVVRLTEAPHSVWVLGAGEQALPALPTATPTSSLPELGPEWAFARDLVAMGLTRRAAVVLEERTRGLADPEQVAQVLMWAAELHASSPDLESALRLLKRVQVEAPEVEVATLSAGVVLTRIHRFSEAADTYATLMQKPSTTAALRREARARYRQLQPLAEAAPTVDLDFSQPLHPAWDIRDPVGIRRLADRGELALQTSADGGVIAALPLTLAGAKISMRLGLEIARAEFGSNIYVGLRPVGGDLRSGLGFAVELWGGGGQTKRALRWYAPDLDLTAIPETERSVSPTHYTESLDVWLSHAPEHGIRVEVRDTRSQSVLISRTEPPTQRPLVSGDWELVIGVLDNDDYGGPLQLKARIRNIEIGGARVRAEVGDAGTWALAEGRPLEALPRLNDRPLMKALALMQLGRFEKAAQVAARSDDLSGQAHLLRRESRGLQGHLQRRMGAAFFDVYARAWAMRFRHQLDADVVSRMSGEAFANMDGGSPAQRQLLLLRAEAGAKHGSTARAQQDLQQLLASGPSPSEARDAYRLLARIAVHQGRPEEAQRHLQACLARWSDPFLARQTLARDPTIAPLLRERPAAK